MKADFLVSKIKCTLVIYSLFFVGCTALVHSGVTSSQSGSTLEHLISAALFPGAMQCVCACVCMCISAYILGIIHMEDDPNSFDLQNHSQCRGTVCLSVRVCVRACVFLCVRHRCRPAFRVNSDSSSINSTACRSFSPAPSPTDQA